MFRSLVGHFFKSSRCTLDNFVFRLHYRVTVGLLIACAVALVWKINFGEPVTCITGEEDNTRYLNDHCWYDGIFTHTSSRSKRVGSEVPAPGIDSQRGLDREYHNIHRWVIIAVLVQAAIFYLPRIIWKCIEGRLIQRLTWNMNDPKKTSSVDMFRKELITNYLKSRSLRNLLYTGGHLLCELLNLINVMVQFFIVSHILQLSFPSVNLFIKGRAERFDDSALSSFPIHTKCDMFRYGPSGDVQVYSVSCVMSINAVMESIFIYQWIWFVLLAILSVLALLYRLVSLVLPPFRILRLSFRANLTNQAVLHKAVRRMRMGEWFVLYMLSKNIDPLHIRDILEGLSNETYVREEVYQLSST